jgi:hypothetical protein
MNVVEIYSGSNGDATKALYARLEALGAAGLVAMNLFRAQKCSDRAKVYHGRRFKDDAYSRKQWSMENLCAILTKHAADLGITWGWKLDPVQEYYPWVLYIDTSAGQISFHTGQRGKGPDYAGAWDGSRGCALRAVSFARTLLEQHGITDIQTQ